MKKITLCVLSILLGLTNLSAFEVANYPQSKIIDSSGNAVAVWNEIDGNGNVAIKGAIKSSGTWGNYYMISHDISSSIEVNDPPKLYSNGVGDVVALWVYFDGSGHGILAASMLPSGTTTWNTSNISSSSEHVSLSDHSLTMNDDGDLLAIWSSTNVSTPSIQRVWHSTSTVGSSTTWSTPAAISQ